MSVTFSIKRANDDKPPIRIAVLDIETKTIGDLKREFLLQINKPRMNINRVRFSIDATKEVLGPNEKGLSSQIKGTPEVTLIYKDLGPQISWRTVFIVEYFVPMVVFPLFRLGKAPTEWQNVLAMLFTMHFVKREFETVFVHRFGNDTMPVFNIFKNSGYYWLFAAWIAYATMHPLYTPPANLMQRKAGVALFIVAELLNLKTHFDLKNLRPPGTRIRKIPNTVLFSLVSCPNYFFEILSWVGFTLASQSVAAAVFTVAGAAQMTQWALQKHRRYRKDFDGKDGREQYPKNRKAIVPFLL